MIYIFEDRKPREEKYLDIVSKYSRSVAFAKFDILENEKLEEFIYENFLEASCILFHKSYTIANQTTNFNAIKDFFTSNNIKFVLFSGGIDNGAVSIDGMSATLNADVMYENLECFVSRYDATDNLDLDLIVWGSNAYKNKIMSLSYDVFTGNDMPVNFVADSPDKILTNIDLDDTVDSVIRKFKRNGYDLRKLYEVERVRYGSSLRVSDLRNILESIIYKLMES